MSEETTKLLREEGLVVVMLPDLKAKRTIFVKKVDEIIGKHTEQELKNEIQDMNRWVKLRYRK